MQHIPYRELYNVGGPGSVRGFEFGQIGPQIFSSSVGAQNAFLGKRRTHFLNYERPIDSRCTYSMMAELAGIPR